jgi:hypothetical protein
VAPSIPTKREAVEVKQSILGAVCVAVLALAACGGSSDAARGSSDAAIGWAGTYSLAGSESSQCSDGDSSTDPRNGTLTISAPAKGEIGIIMSNGGFQFPCPLKAKINDEVAEIQPTVCKDVFMEGLTVTITGGTLKQATMGADAKGEAVVKSYSGTIKSTSNYPGDEYFSPYNCTGTITATGERI